jgi:hypothetical protein
MAYFAGLDVSVKETSVCIVDDAGKIDCLSFGLAHCQPTKSIPAVATGRIAAPRGFSGSQPKGPG